MLGCQQHLHWQDVNERICLQHFPDAWSDFMVTSNGEVLQEEGGAGCEAARGAEVCEDIVSDALRFRQDSNVPLIPHAAGWGAGHRWGL